MIILRQISFSRKKKENLNLAWEHPLTELGESSGPEVINAEIYRYGLSDTNELGKKFNKARLTSSNTADKVRRVKGHIMYPTLRYKNGHVRVYGSTPKTSYKDSYRGFLRNEEALNNYRGNNPERFYDNGESGPTNEDIKNEIRRLAKRETIKRWGGIGLASVATIGGGAYLLHRHNKKKKGKKEDDNKDEENKNSRK